MVLRREPGWSASRLVAWFEEETKKDAPVEGIIPPDLLGSSPPFPTVLEMGAGEVSSKLIPSTGREIGARIDEVDEVPLPDLRVNSTRP